MDTLRLGSSLTSLSSSATTSSSSSSSSSNTSTSTRSSRLSPSSESNRSEAFWGQFDRIGSPSSERKTVWQMLKKMVKKREMKKATKRLSGVNGENADVVTQEEVPTPPEGLYCVIDDFLETYMDVGEDFATTKVEEEYAEIVDTYDDVYESVAVAVVTKQKIKLQAGHKEMKVDDCLKDHVLLN